MTTTQLKPSISRGLARLSAAHQRLLTERYQRLLPVLLQLLRPRDILERNRAWPGVSPIGKGATRLLLVKHARAVRDCIKRHVMSQPDDPDELWRLLRAYCRFGPIGLLEALPSSLPPLVDDALQACADFHRLAKHPRSDAGIYIRELLDQYASDLGLPRLPPFAARYAFTTDRRITRWFVGEGEPTEHVPKSYRRLNLRQPYPNQAWTLGAMTLPVECLYSRRHPAAVTPWLLWTTDSCTSQMMGLRLCPAPPTPRDLLLTLRWSIWHYGAPWWPARGAPDLLLAPAQFGGFEAAAQRALSYIHTRVSPSATPTADDSALPAALADWVWALERSARFGQVLGMTLADLTALARDHMRDATAASVAAAPTPVGLAEQQVSLPWSMGIAAALLLPSAGTHTVAGGTVSLWGVPFDAADLPDGARADLRHDPDDARAVYLIAGGAQVIRAPAAAFEHYVPWSELINSPSMLGEHL
jgi:hypothetical protein